METVTRSVAFKNVRATDEGDGLTLSGYAAVFDSPTTIRGERPALFDERISRGAFAKTISENTPVLQFDHGKHPFVGSLPIGQITTLREDNRGLFVEARLFDNHVVQPVRDAIAGEAIKGMSFRFSVPEGKDEWDYSGDVPLRTINEVRCVELGPVVFPAYTDTLVGVRDDDRSDMTYQSLRDTLEGALREQLAPLRYLWVRDFTDTWVVYEITDDSGEETCFKVDYTIDDDSDSVMFAEPVEVTAVISYEPVAAALSDSDDPGTRDEAATPGTSHVEPPATPVEPPPDSTRPLTHAAARLRLSKAKEAIAS